MHIWAHIFFYLSIIVILLLVAMLFTPEGRVRAKSNKTKYAFVILFWACIGVYTHNIYKPSSSTSATSQQVTSGYQQLGHKIKKSEAKKDKDGFYYTDKTDKKIRYFTDDDGTITAVKCNFMPNPMGYTAVQSKLNGILNDDHVKYGNDKLDADETDLKGDNYNVYSPKHKKWYHMSIQKDDDGKVSEFSVWPGKQGQGDIE